jgi:hypothetical protein
MTNFITDYFNKLDIDSPKVTSIVPVFKWTPVIGNTMIISNIDEKSKDLKNETVLNNTPVNKQMKLISKSKNYFDKRRHNRINKSVPNNSESDSEKYTDTKKIDNIKKLFDSDFKFFFPKK